MADSGGEGSRTEGEGACSEDPDLDTVFVDTADEVDPAGRTDAGDPADAGEPADADDPADAGDPIDMPETGRVTDQTGDSGTGGDDDPTGANWWVWLSWGTAFSALVLIAWPIPVLAWDVLERTVGGVLGGVGAIGLLLGVGAVFVVRFVLLPVALFRDARLLHRTTHVEWDPSLGFYLLFGAIAATPTCGYYLYKRARHTGHSIVPFDDSLLYYEDRTIRSNWSLVIAGGLVAGVGGGGFGLLLDGLDRVLGEAAIVVVWPLLLAVLVLAACRFVLLPIAFYRDAKAVHRADVDWTPRWSIYAVFGYLFALPFCAYYLYKRGKHGDPIEQHF